MPDLLILLLLQQTLHIRRCRMAEETERRKQAQEEDAAKIRARNEQARSKQVRVDGELSVFVKFTSATTPCNLILLSPHPPFRIRA